MIAPLLSMESGLVHLTEIGIAIRTARKEQKLTIAELTAELGMSAATLSRLENGIIEELGIRKVLRVMERLGLDLQARPARSGYTMDDAKADRDNEFPTM